MKKSAAFVSIIAGVSIFVQVIGQIIITRIFGAKVELDIFLAAVALPTVIVSAVYGTLSDTIIPLLKQQKTDDKETYIISTAVVLGSISIVVSLILIFFSKEITMLFYGTQKGRFIEETAYYMKYLMLSLPLALVNTVFGAYLYSKKKFIIFPFAQLVGSIINLGIVYIFGPSLGVISLIIGFFASLIIQLPFILPPFKLSNFITFKPSYIQTFKVSNLPTLLLSWLPLIISSFAMRTDILVTRSLAASLPEGYIVYVNLASKLFAASVGVMTIGIQTIFLPHLVDVIYSKQTNNIQRQVTKAKAAAWIVSIVVVGGIMLVAPYFMRLLLVGGKFTHANVEILISIFPYFIVPALGWGVSQIYFQPLIALRKQHLLLCLNIIAALLAWISSSLTHNIFGPLPAISVELIVILFTGIIGSEILWQKELKKLLLTQK